MLRKIIPVTTTSTLLLGSAILIQDIGLKRASADIEPIYAKHIDRKPHEDLSKEDAFKLIAQEFATRTSNDNLTVSEDGLKKARNFWEALRVVNPRSAYNFNRALEDILANQNK